MTSNTSQEFESYVPVYDTVPEKYEELRQFLNEQLRKITESLNVKEIGFYLNEELITGAQFVPGTATPPQFRSIFRKTIPCGPLAAGANSAAHGINFDSNFTLLKIYVGATDSVSLIASMITDDNLDMDALNININSPRAYDRAFAVVEYILEV